MTEKFSYRDERGQVLLIVVLIMVVSLTVGLSVSLRSITNVRSSTEEEQSQRALSAAEAGIEQALSSNQQIQDLRIGENSIVKSVQITPLSGSELILNNGNIIERDDGEDVWLVPHTASDVPDYASLVDRTLEIHWGDSSGACNNAAVEIITLYDDPVNPKTKREVFDPCGARGDAVANPNPFPTPSSGTIIQGRSFSYKASITITKGIILRVVPLFKNTYVGARVTSGVALPSQGRKIDSTGESGDTQRKITFFRGYPKLPAELFQYILFLTP